MRQNVLLAWYPIKAGETTITFKQCFSLECWSCIPQPKKNFHRFPNQHELIRKQEQANATDTDTLP